MTGQKEIVTYMFPSVLAQLLRVFGGVKKLLDSKGGAFDRIAKQPGMLVSYLQWYPAYGGRNYGLALPQRLGNRQSKALLK